MIFVSHGSMSRLPNDFSAEYGFSASCVIFVTVSGGKILNSWIRQYGPILSPAGFSALTTSDSFVKNYVNRHVVSKLLKAILKFQTKSRKAAAKITEEKLQNGCKTPNVNFCSLFAKLKKILIIH